MTMKQITAFILVSIFCLASCVTGQGGGAAGAGGETAAGGPQAAAQAPKPLNSFKTGERIYFAGGSGGAYTPGALDEYTVFEWDSAFTTILKETRYSASDSVLEKTEYTYAGNNPLTKTVKAIVSDEKGKEQEQVRTQVEYQYAQDRLWKETLKNKDGNVISSYEYRYDNQGNRAGRVMKNAKDQPMTETVYGYANGRLASAETKSSGGNRISSIEYQYDAQGSLVKQETRNAGGEVTSVLTSVWQNGLEMKNELAGADNALRQREFNEYGPEGELLKKTIENIQGKSARIIRYEYAVKTAGR
jgi:hypothetical protein